MRMEEQKSDMSRRSGTSQEEPGESELPVGRKKDGSAHGD
jgi:hypothetical protein